MRILLTAQPSYSHLVPFVLPVADLLRRAGHEVVVATGPGMTEHIEEYGLEPLILPNAMSRGEIMRYPDLVAEAGGTPPPGPPGSVTISVTPESFAGNFVRVLGSRFAHDLIDVLQDWKPDLILREGSEYGGYLAGEYLGIPQGVLDISPMAPFDHPVVLHELNEQRRRLGLGPVSDPWHPARTFRAAVVPESFYPAHSRLETARYYRSPTTGAGERLDPAIADLPGDRPLVLASLGSNAPGMLSDGPSVLDTIIEALGELRVTGVVALGADRDPRQWRGARADNVHLTSFVQQRILLGATDVFITHSGFNGTREALEAGVPMVAIPMFAEQSANAARVADLGAGIALQLETTTARAIVDAVRRVLDEPAYRARARAVQRRLFALPPLSRIADDIAGLLR